MLTLLSQGTSCEGAALPGFGRSTDFASKPDVTFYFQVPIDIAINRILVGRSKLKYYEAGMDLNLSNDPFDSYRIFQSRIIDQYESMVEHEDFTVIDATRDIEEQQIIVRQKVLETLPQQLVNQIKGQTATTASIPSVEASQKCSLTSLCRDRWSIMARGSRISKTS